MRVWRRLVILGLSLACCLAMAQSARPDLLTPPEWRREGALGELAVAGWLAGAARLDRVDALDQGMKPSAQSPLPELAALARSLPLVWAAEPRVWPQALAELAGLAWQAAQAVACTAYERVFGVLGEAAYALSPEDALAVRVERDYLLFSRQQPWYRYDFMTPLRQLWTALPADGPAWRRWERRYLLTSVWGARALAAAGMRLLFPVPARKPVTAVVVDRWLAPLGPVWPDLQRVRSFRDGSQLLLLPRDADVATRLLAIALEGADFIEIAGNPEEAPIELAVRAPTDWLPEQAEVELLHVQPVAGRAGEAHLILRTSVGSLARQLREFQVSGILLEKVFDY